MGQKIDLVMRAFRREGHIFVSLLLFMVMVVTAVVNSIAQDMRDTKEKRDLAVLAQGQCELIYRMIQTAELAKDHGGGWLVLEADQSRRQVNTDLDLIYPGQTGDDIRGNSVKNVEDCKNLGSNSKIGVLFYDKFSRVFARVDSRGFRDFDK